MTSFTHASRAASLPGAPRPCAALAGALALVVGLAGPARAQPAGRDADKLEAQRLLVEGNRDVGEGDYLAAIEKFRAAHARFPSPKILLNIGTALRMLGRYAEAAKVYEEYEKTPGADPARIAEVRRALGEIDSLSARLRIQVSRPSATVRVDGVVVALPPDGAVRVDPGAHNVLAEEPGFLPALQSVTIAKGEERAVVLTLARPGERQVLVERVIEGPQRTIGIVIGSVGLAGLAGGAAAGVVSILKNDAAKGHCRAQGSACDPQGISLDSAGRAAGTASTIAFVAGGATLATGLVIFLTVPKRARQAGSSALDPIVVASPDGLWIGGRARF